MTTNARTFTENSAQFYLKDGTPFYEVPYADAKKGMRRATLADARKVGALPGPTTILKCLAKPELQNWITEQALLAVGTTPKLPEECHPPCKTCGHAELKSLDAFIHRVLHVEKIQDQERDTAAERGTAIHAALACYFTGQTVDPELLPWIGPAVEELCRRGQYVCCEKVLVGNGYAGRCDLILESPECFWIVDHKTTKTLPTKGAYPEAIIQCSAYAAAFASKLPGEITHKSIRTANVYISTVEQGKFVICDHDPDWQKVYNTVFLSLLKVWCYLNNYYPAQ